MGPSIETRGERVQVERPDCDSWVILSPAESVAKIALGAMDNTFPGASDTLAAIAVFTASCVCGATITLTLTRSKQRIAARAQA